MAEKKIEGPLPAAIKNEKTKNEKNEKTKNRRKKNHKKYIDDTNKKIEEYINSLDKQTCAGQSYYYDSETESEKSDSQNKEHDIIEEYDIIEENNQENNKENNQEINNNTYSLFSKLLKSFF